LLLLLFLVLVLVVLLLFWICGWFGGDVVKEVKLEVVPGCLERCSTRE